MNTFCMVGQIDSLPDIKEISPGCRQATLTLKVQRPYRESDGGYIFDYIPIQVWRGLADTIATVAKLDHWISVKGRIASNTYSRNGRSYTAYNFVAENISFIH